MPKILNANWPLAQSLYLQGVSLQDIAKQINVTLGSLRKRANRGNWTVLRRESVQIASTVVQGHTGRNLVQASRDVRQSLAEEVADQVSILRESPPKKVSELGNTPDGQGRAAVTKTVIDSAASVFGWDDSPERGIIVIGELRQFDEMKTVDVSASVEVAPVVLEDAQR